MSGSPSARVLEIQAEHEARCEEIGVSAATRELYAALARAEALRAGASEEETPGEENAHGVQSCVDRPEGTTDRARAVLSGDRRQAARDEAGAHVSVPELRHQDHAEVGTPAPVPERRDPQYVVQGNHCDTCDLTHSWYVIGPDGDSVGRVFLEEFRATEACDLWNAAFEEGMRRAALGSAPARPIAPAIDDEVLRDMRHPPRVGGCHAEGWHLCTPEKQAPARPAQAWQGDDYLSYAIRQLSDAADKREDAPASSAMHAMAARVALRLERIPLPHEVTQAWEAEQPRDCEKWPCSFSHHEHATRAEAVKCAQSRQPSPPVSASSGETPARPAQAREEA